jgi:hypothetical protein
MSKPTTLEVIHSLKGSVISILNAPRGIDPADTVESLLRYMEEMLDIMEEQAAGI